MKTSVVFLTQIIAITLIIVTLSFELNDYLEAGIIGLIVGALTAVLTYKGETEDDT